MASLPPHSLRGRLLLLVVLAFIPAVGLFIYANLQLRRVMVEAGEEELLRSAEVISADYRRLIDETRALLFALSGIEEVRDYRNPDCDRLLARVLEGTPRQTALAVIALDGYRVCGAQSLDAPLYLGDRSYVMRAMGTKRFAVGDYQVGRITGKPTVGLAYPVLDEQGDIVCVLATTLDLNRLAEHASGAELPEGSTFTLLDRAGRVLVRFPEAERVGEVPGPDFPPVRPLSVEPTVVEGVDLDGADRNFAITPLLGEGSEPEGYLAVGLSEGSAAANVNRMFRTDLGLLGFSAILLFLIAWGYGHSSILRQTSAIIEAERRFAGGDLSARTGLEYGDDELGGIARAFDEMASRIQARQEHES
jgi:HAMP domain-containing protein